MANAVLNAEQSQFILNMPPHKSRDDLEDMGHGLMVDALISLGMLKETHIFEQESCRVISNLTQVVPTKTYYDYLLK